MRKFEVWNLAMLLHHINHSLEVIKPMATDKELRDEHLSASEIETWLLGNIMMAQVAAKEAQLESTFKRVWAGGGPFWMASQVGITWQQAENELRVLRQAIEADLEDRMFVFVIPEKATLLDHMQTEWTDVWKAIPDSEPDIKEALYSYALERNTAAVFHLMRTAEWGLRALCHHFGRINTETVRSSGTIKLTPVEFSMWEKIIDSLWDDMEKTLNQIPAGPQRQKMQEFYKTVLLEIDAFKDAWRNHVMHTRREYTAEEAAAILLHVKRFMSLLVLNGVTTL